MIFKKQDKTIDAEKQFQDDSPISSLKDDAFNRAPFVQNLANALIENARDKADSKAIALTGSWGVGKTSVINMIRTELKKKASKLQVIDFFPWQYTNNDDLIKPFLENLYYGCKSIKLYCLRRKISKYYKSFDFSQLKDNFLAIVTALGSLVGFLVSLIKEDNQKGNICIPVFQDSLPGDVLNKIQILCYLVPLLVFIVLFCISLFKILNNLLKTKIDSKKISLLEQKNTISDYVKKHKLHFIIIVDDIDRLTPEETLQMFRIIRANADFSNTTYLISFDKDVVVNNLNNIKIQGSGFIEKIVTSEYVLSEPLEFYLRNYISKELIRFSGLNKQWTQDLKTDEYKFNQIVIHISSILENMRGIKRYLNSLYLHLQNVVSENIVEVNFVDLVIIECLMLKSRTCYYGILHNKNLFTQTSESSVRKQTFFLMKEDESNKAFNEKKSILKETIISIVGIEEQKKSDAILKLILWMFPNLYFLFEKEIHLSLLNYRPNQTAGRNICVPNYFDSYFTSSINIDDPEHVSNKELSDFINSSNSKIELLEYLSDCYKNGKLHLMLEIIADVCKTDSFIAKENASHFVAAMFDATYIPTAKQKKELTYDLNEACCNINLAYLKKFPKIVEDILSEAIKEIEHIYPLGYFIFFQNEYFKVGNTSSSLFFNQEDLLKINKEFVKKVIESYKNSNDFWKNEKLEDILSYWHVFDEISFNKKMQAKVLTDKKLCNLMITLYKRRRSIEYSYFPYSTLQYFGDLSQFKTRIENALNGSTLNKREKIIAKYFLERYQYGDMQVGLVDNEEVKVFDKEREEEDNNE